MDNVKISLIVPVYNSKDYVGAAIESVFNQDFEDFELILVNDGSTDGSEKVCEQFVAKDNRVKLINKKNGGLCSARNAGIDVAIGEYIMFMDNDDELSETAMTKVWSIIEKYHSDIVRFNRKRIQIFDDGSKKEDTFGCKGICDDDKPHYFTRKHFFSNYRRMRYSGCFAGIWNGAFKRSLFDDIRFDTAITAGGEDNLVNLLLYNKFQSIVFVPDTLYTYYRRTTHSISTAYEENHFIANIKCAREEKRLILDNNVKIDEYYHPAVIYLATSIKVMIHKASPLSSKEIVKKLEKFRRTDCYSFKIKDILRSSASMIDKLYLSLFSAKLFRLTLLVSKIVFGVRGNA